MYISMCIVCAVTMNTTRYTILFSFFFFINVYRYTMGMYNFSFFTVGFSCPINKTEVGRQNMPGRARDRIVSVRIIIELLLRRQATVVYRQQNYSTVFVEIDPEIFFVSFNFILLKDCVLYVFYYNTLLLFFF